MTTIRPKDETRVTAPTAGDALLLDGATARSIAVEDFYKATIASDAELAAFCGVTSAANELFYFTGPGAGALVPVTAFGLTLVGSTAIANSMIAPGGAATLKGNPGAAPAVPSDFTVQGLSALASPHATLDFLVIYDHVSGTLKSATPGSIAGAISAGVGSFNSRTGTVVSRADDYANLDGLGLKNVSFAVSASAGALTITMNDASGSPLSASSPAVIAFRSATAGQPVSRVITSSPSITLPSGSTCGIGSASGCRLWIVGWDDAGPTFRLGVFNARDGGHIYPLDESMPGSSLQATSGSTSPGQHYTAGAAVTGKSFRILGYVDWSAAGMTAGTWTLVNLNNVQLMGFGTKRPGEPIGNRAWLPTAGGSSTTSTSQVDVTGANVSITPRSAANVMRFSATHTGTVGAPGAGQNSLYSSQFLRTATLLASGQIGVASGGGANQQSLGTIAYIGIDGGFNSQGAAITYKIQHATSNAAAQATTSSINIDVEEIMG